ncbi:MAG: hypothetical protein DMF90_07145 [Acidobacteria bacterium]|nr:MAG: hypothetical protein DMF90_07145 [Acidobacteriota bacterium]
MARCVGVFALVLAVLLLTPSVTSAQAIGGTVTDPSGSVLPGVTVEVKSPALIEQVRTAFTNGAGQYQIIELRPGTYSVTFTLPGFGTLVREGIELTSGFTATVDVQLRVGTVQETVTVTGASPLVDVQNVTQQRVATREVIDTMPVAKSFQSLGVLIPGVTTGGSTNNQTQDVGGQSGQSHFTLAIHGGRTRDQHVAYDGLNVESMNREDSAGPWVPEAASQEIAFNYSANGAEMETGGVRVNHIPAEGGNTLRGGAFFTITPPSWQTTNFDDRLRALGVTGSNRVKELWMAEVKVGGRIIRDKMWFFLSHGWFQADEYVLGAYYNQDIRGRRFVPDLSRQALSTQGPDFTSTGRLTWQATPRNKITAFITNGEQHYPIWLTGLLGTVTRAPEAPLHPIAGNNVYQASWSAPVTSRLLVEAGLGHNPQQVHWWGQDWAANDIPGILDLANNTYSRNTAAAWLATKRESPYRSWTGRAALSYVTGSHSFRTGFSYMDTTQSDTQYFHDELGALPLTYLTNNGAAVQATFYQGYATRNYIMHNLGIHGEDQWRVKRLTVNAGVRFDHILNRYPDQRSNPSIFVPVATFFPAADAVRWSDLSPRLGVAYDLFGDGKTAIKASANRYILRSGNQYAKFVNPLDTNRSNARSWTDTNGNFFPDGDPLNPDRNGELGPSANRNFANPKINAFYDPNWAFGWRQRPSDWEFSTGVQREVASGLSAAVAYFRRVYTNFEVVNNQAFGPSDVDYFCVTAPASPALPGGGGNQVCGIPDLKPNKVGILDNITTRADDFGTRLQHWNGVDATVNARLRGILMHRDPLSQRHWVAYSPGPMRQHRRQHRFYRQRPHWQHDAVADAGKATRIVHAAVRGPGRGDVSDLARSRAARDRHVSKFGDPTRVGAATIADHERHGQRHRSRHGVGGPAASARPEVLKAREGRGVAAEGESRRLQHPQQQRAAQFPHRVQRGEPHPLAATWGDHAGAPVQDQRPG